MSVSLRQLEIFVAVVKSGSISRAAPRVNLSQPTISQNIARLEEDLGTALMLRSRTPHVDLTAAGEFWYRHGLRLLEEMRTVQAEHDLRHSGKGPPLRFGTTPSLRGRFLSAAARIATASGRFSRFDFLCSLNSGEVREQVSLHQLNCAVVSEASIVAEQESLHVTRLYEDQIVWVVPADLSDAAIARALRSGRAPPHAPALERYVDVGGSVPWHERSANWYRAVLPFSMPYFGCLTHEASVELVAAGLATCHAPLSLFPNLPEPVRQSVRLLALEGFSRSAVLIMPRHLLSIGPFASFREKLADFAREQEQREMHGGQIDPLPVDPSPVAEIE